MKEGKVSKNPSFIFMRTPRPNNISKAIPPEEIIKIGWNNSPTSNPTPPNSWREPTRFVNFFKPKRSNSFLTEELKKIADP